jgi:hypothetical protein
MRLTIIFAVIALFTLVSCTTNRSVTNAFHKYGNEEGVVKVSVPGWVISLGASFADLSKEERKLVRSLDKVKVLTIEDPELNSRVNFYKEYYQEIRSKNGYEDLVMVRENNDDVGILGKFEGERVKELIILIGGEENTIVYLKGDIHPDMLKEITGKTHRI